jgi:hypothetical protein
MNMAGTVQSLGYAQCSVFPAGIAQGIRLIATGSAGRRPMYAPPVAAATGPPRIHPLLRSAMKP